MFINEIYTYLAQTTVLLPSFGPVCICAKKLPHVTFASEWGVILVVESINIVSRSKKQYNI